MIRKRVKKVFSLMLVLFLSIGFCSIKTSSAFEDAIIAVVNDELITANDLKSFLKSQYVELISRGIPKEEIMKRKIDLEVNGLNKLIEERLLLSKATEIGYEPGEKVIEERIENIKANYPDEKTFLQALGESGATITDLRKKFKDQIKIKMLLDSRLKSKVFVNPGEITTYYYENMDNFKTHERINLYSIFIAYGTDKDLAEERLMKAVELIDQGEDFLGVSKKFSDSPSIGIIERGELMPEIEDEVFKLKVDEISQPIETDSGYYVFQLKGRLTPRIASLKEAEKDIKSYLYQKKYASSMTEFIGELKDEAYIEIKQ